MIARRLGLRWSVAALLCSWICAVTSVCAGSPPGTEDLRQRSWLYYVDCFTAANYDLGHNFDPADGRLSTSLRLTYADGVAVDVDLNQVGEEEPDEATFDRYLNHPRLGPGQRVFPERMNRRTTPRLWAAKHQALITMDRYNRDFIARVLGTVSLVLPTVALGLRPLPPEALEIPPLRVRARPPATSLTAKAPSQLTPGAPAVTADWVRVTRWVSPREAETWVGRETLPQPLPTSGNPQRVYVTEISLPKPGGTGPIRMDFDVPRSALQTAGRPGWWQIFNEGRNVPLRNLVIQRRE